MGSEKVRTIEIITIIIMMIACTIAGYTIAYTTTPEPIDETKLIQPYQQENEKQQAYFEQQIKDLEKEQKQTKNKTYKLLTEIYDNFYVCSYMVYCDEYPYNCDKEYEQAREDYKYGCLAPEEYQIEIDELING